MGGAGRAAGRGVSAGDCLGFEGLPAGGVPRICCAQLTASVLLLFCTVRGIIAETGFDSASFVFI